MRFCFDCQTARAAERKFSFAYDYMVYGMVAIRGQLFFK